MSEKNVSQLLQNIVSSSQKFLIDFSDKSYHDIDIPTANVALPALRLTKPTLQFRTEVLGTNFLPQICKLATELASLHQHSYERICRRLMTCPSHLAGLSINQVIDHLRSAHENLYEHKSLPRLRQDALKAQLRYCKGPELHKERRAFNHEYTPLLEKYFEHNAYPSAADRLILARKTMMTPRQIEVWFQNHRNRGRKEGRTLARRTAASGGLNISLESLEDRMPSVSFSESGRGEVNGTDDSDDESLNETDFTTIPKLSGDIFSDSAPPHAFPTKFPPQCINDPFPSKFECPPIQWGRRPARTDTQQHVPINMDEFVAMFASKLNLHEGVSKRQTQLELHGCKNSRRPWFSAIVTIPVHAPHPALIRPSPMPYPSTSTSPPLLSPVSDVQPSPPQSRSSTPETFIHNVAKSRKLAPLPRRIPKNTCSSKRVSPPSPSSTASRSRTSSFSSMSSLQSRASSSSSLPSNDPGTPEAFECQSFTTDHFLNGLFGPVPDHIENEYAIRYSSMNDIFTKQIPFNCLAAQS